MSDPIKSLAQQRCEAIGKKVSYSKTPDGQQTTSVFQGNKRTGVLDYNSRSVKHYCIYEDPSGENKKVIENKEVALNWLDRLRLWWNS